MASYRQSGGGRDFGNGDALKQHVDMRPTEKATMRPNWTEHSRLQGLQRNSTLSLHSIEPSGPLTRRERFNVWMINEGGKRLFFAAFIFLHLLVIFLGGLHYRLQDNLNDARATFSWGYIVARTAALVCHVDIIFILLPVCRNFISMLRRTPLNDVVPFDKNLTFHKAVACSLAVFSVIHIGAHMYNFSHLAIISETTTAARVKEFFLLNFWTGPGLTGWFMTPAFCVIIWYAREKARRANFERFWYSHQIAIIPFFVPWQMHGMFCLIKPDFPPYCDYNIVGVFWRYFLVGGVIYITERIWREIRARKETTISKVIQHPSNVVELQIKKPSMHTRAGQYIFLNCPSLSFFQWHPFTLTSAPEEDYISVHIRVVGDFTAALADALGCEFDKKGGIVDDVSLAKMPLTRPLPKIMVDGPYGSASEDFAKFETVLLVGAGIGVTPFASILKTIWYRMNHSSKEKPTRLSKVYFTWVIKDFGAAEWFHSLLHAIEEEDTEGRIEISLYLTAKVKADDINNIFVQDVGAEKDAVTSLRAPTHFGRPNWDRVFKGLSDKHPETDVGVFFCGPPVLSKQLHQMSNKYSKPNGTRFFFGKENF